MEYKINLLERILLALDNVPGTRDVKQQIKTAIDTIRNGEGQYLTLKDIGDAIRHIHYESGTSADVVSFNDSNTSAKGSNLQSLIEDLDAIVGELGGKLSELEEEIVGFSRSQEVTLAGQSSVISSIDVEANKTYRIVIDKVSGTEGGNLYIYESAKKYNTGVNIILIEGASVNFTPTSNDFIRLYYQTAARTVVGFSVFDEGGIKQQIIDIEDDIDEIREAVEKGEHTSIVTPEYNQTNIIYPNGNLVYNASYKSINYTKVSAGDKLIISGETGDVNYPVCAGYNEGKSYVGVIVAGGLKTNVEVLVPDGVSYIVATSKNNNQNLQIFNVVKNLTTDDYDKISENIETDYIAIEKSTTGKTDFFVVSHRKGKKDIRHKFKYNTKTFSSVEYIDESGTTQTASNVLATDVWNLAEVYIDSKYIAQGNSNFSSLVSGDAGWTGNGHGNEVMKYFDILVDGKHIDIESFSGKIKGANVKVIWRGDVYSCGYRTAGEYGDSQPKLDVNGNKIVNFEHFIELNFIDNKVEIDNKLIIKRDNLKFIECNGAMLEVHNTDFTTITANTAERTINYIEEGADGKPIYSAIGGSATILKGRSIRANKAEMFGKDFYISQSCINRDTTRKNLSTIIFNQYEGATFESSITRLKCYFQPIISSYAVNGRTAGMGDSTLGEVETFNAGDFIEVYCERVIESV